MQKRVIAVLLGGSGRPTPAAAAISRKQLPALLRPANRQTDSRMLIT